MPPLRRTRNGALIAATIIMTGCQSYRPYTPPPVGAGPDATTSLRKAQVTTVDGRTLNLVAVTIRPDSVVGTMAGARTALSRADVHSIREHRTDLAATATLGAVGLAVVGGVLYIRMLRGALR